MVQLLGQGRPHEDLGGVFSMDHGRPLFLVEGHAHRLADGRQGHQEPADHAGHAGDSSVAEHGADAHTHEVHPVAVDVAFSREVVHRLCHAVDVDRVVQVVFGDRPLAECSLDAVDGDGTGVDHSFDTGPTGRLKHVVGAADVDLHGVVVPFFGVRGQ